MRFLADGPNVPDELLVAHERGEVLFLCGAGVSMPAGLPSFLKLTDLAMARLGVREDDPDRRNVERALAGDDAVMLPPLDSLFERLKRDYGDLQVEALVTKLLCVPKGADLSLHRAVLDLSRDPHGKTRLVTTNFDPCFESAGAKKIIHCAPMLPEFHDDYPLEGVIYLHGRVNGARTRQSTPRLVLGSSDFGRAYLALGWATRFVRAALERYTVVLLGYSADDPPINYLLQGLRSLQSSDIQPIYAFAEASRPEAVARWRDRRVNAITYERGDARHSGLWDTLKAWAARARDQTAWRTGVLGLAAQNPRALKPHERGQVASLVKNEAGALAFATAKPSPPAEWLCVFDAQLRYEQECALTLGGEETFDPLEAYGLDDDPPRKKARSSHEPAPTGIDLLAANADDAQHAGAGRLAGAWSIAPNPLPPRLGYLSGWIASSWLQPATIWWAAGKDRLHPDLVQRLDVAMLQNKTEAPRVRSAWALVQQTCAEPVSDRHWQWHGLADEVPREGWSPPVLRSFAAIVRPRMTMSRQTWTGFAPALKEENLTPASDAVSFKLSWFTPSLKTLPQTAEALSAIVREVREALRYGTDLHADLRGFDRCNASLRPERRRGERALSEADKFFVWYSHLFEALEKVDIAAARAEMAAWPATDNPWFDKLRVWAWERPSLVAPAIAAAGLVSLSQRTFWDGHLQRELLFTLKARWSEFAEADRSRIAARILAGPDRYRTEEDADYVARKAREPVVMLLWLEQEGCTFSPECIEQRDALKATLPEWRDSWVTHAAHSMETQVGWVGTKEDFHHVRDLPFGEITSRCAETEGERSIGSFTRLDPFLGLTKNAPCIALAALSADSRRGQHPVRYWRTLLQSWPDTVAPRATFALGMRIARLPAATLVELRHQAPDWLKQFAKVLDAYRADTSLVVWDAIFAPFAGGEDADSGLVSITEAGVPVDDVAHTLDAAINAPVGTLTQSLIDLIDARKLERGAGFPAPLAMRLSACLAVPGIGGAHAAAVTAEHLRWLHYIDPNWAVREIVPRLDLRHAHAKAAWDGLLHDNRLPVLNLFTLLKPAFLGALKDAAAWRGRDGARQLGRILCAAALASTTKHTFLTHAEARAALQTTTSEVRDAALEQLSYEMEHPTGWKKFGRPFLEDIWPRELAVQSPETALKWAEIAAEARSDFPDSVKRLRASPVLVQIEHLDSFVWSMTQPQRDGVALAAAYPRAVVELLAPLVGVRARRIYDLRKLVDALLTADPSLRDDEQFRKLTGEGLNR